MRFDSGKIMLLPCGLKAFSESAHLLAAFGLIATHSLAQQGKHTTHLIVPEYRSYRLQGSADAVLTHQM